MSETLVTQSEKYLKNIQRHPILAESIDDYESFIETYSYLKNNLTHLQNLRNKMEVRGFTSPYSGLKRFGKGTSGNMDIIPEDVQDQSRHAQYFRIKASNKKNILDQVKSAIASHKIAIGHLGEYVTLTCNKCEQNYKKNSIEDMLIINDEEEVEDVQCTCGCKDFSIEFNNSGICRPEIIKYLPLGGEYLLKRSQLTKFSLEAYRKIIKVMKQEKRGMVKSVTVIAKVKDEKTNKWVSRKANIDYADESNYELELRKRYGPNVRIELLQFHHKKPSLINDKYVQNALAISYLQYSENIVKQKMDDIIPEHIHNMDKINSYNKAVEEARNDASKLAREADERIELEEELKYIKLKKLNLMNKERKLDKELRDDLERREDIQRFFYRQTPKTLIIWDIFKYYLTTTESRRSNYSGPFPNLRPSLDSNQIKVFDTQFRKDIVKMLQENGENIDSVSNMKEAIHYKSDLETKIKNLHLKTNQECIGAIVLHNKCNISLKHATELINVDYEETNKEKMALNRIEKPSTNKAKKFLELINK